MSDKLELKGKIKLIEETNQVSDKFKKRSFVVTIDADSKYPQDIPLEFTQDKVSSLDAFSVGDEVTVAFNLRGNEYKGKHYLSLSAWKIDGASPF